MAICTERGWVARYLSGMAALTESELPCDRYSPAIAKHYVVQLVGLEKFRVGVRCHPKAEKQPGCSNQIRNPHCAPRKNSSKAPAAIVRCEKDNSI